MESRLERIITESGPMPVSRWMQHCLYHPDDGFYMRPRGELAGVRAGGRAGGRAGDFLTAPETGPLFGSVLARALDEWWTLLGQPAPFTVIDWGAGPGTLARSVLAASPQCQHAGALRYVAVELSSAQRAMHPKHPALTSVANTADALDRPVTGIVLANELLDNLPFDILQRSSAGWVELRVSTSDTRHVNSGARHPGRFSPTSAPAAAAKNHRTENRQRVLPVDSGTRHPDRFSLTAAPAAADLLAELPSELVNASPAEIPVGSAIPVQRAARSWVSEAIDAVESGWVIAIDYGATTPVLARRPAVGWLRTHRSHSSGGSWLDSPGSCDITSDVAFDQIQADHPAEVLTLADFLRAHGIKELVEDGRAAWAELAHIGGLDALRARSRITEAEALLDPAGLGAHRVLMWQTAAH